LSRPRYNQGSQEKTMILDMENMLSWKQVITVTATSTNVIDLGDNHWAKASGSDREIPMFLKVDEAFTAGGAATLTVAIQSSNAEAFGSGVVTHWEKTYALADLVTLLRAPENIGIPSDVKRYVRANYTVGTGPMTAGKVSLGVTASRQTNF